MTHRMARRDVLKMLGVVASGLVAPWDARAQPRQMQPPPDAGRIPAGGPTETYLRVSVHQPGGDHLDQEASVTLQDGDPVVLRRTRPKVTYEAVVQPGTHRLVVKAEGFADVDYTINVPPAGLNVPVYLGRPGWPSFRMGQSVVPFEPKEELISIVFIGKPPSEPQWPSLLQQMQRIGLVPYPDRASYLAAGKTIAFFQSAKPGQKIFGADQGAPDLIESVSLLFGKGNARVGMPIDLRPGRIKILDNAYVVRFGSSRTGRSVRSLACAQLAIAYPLPSSPNTWVLEFDERNDYRKHLNSLEELRAHDPDVLYAEPKLIVELQKHSCPDPGLAHSCATVVTSNVTKDPWSNCQTNLVLQGVPDAWCFLEQTAGAANRRGSPDLCIATVDVGINKTHPDVKADYVSLCDWCPGVPEDPHGMGVYGIISATPDNQSGTSGIAPGTRHVAIQMRSYWTDPTQYAEMLLWLSGVESSVTFSEPPLATPADIISCSHGIADLPTANPIALAFERLTQEGRNHSGGVSMGTVLVYSSGNENRDITGTQALAADPNVISVGNTLPPDPSGVEKRQSDSNYGDRLDLCAQGQDAPSLLADPTQLSSTGSCTPSIAGPGAFQFGGTSAACPMVAAAAALMLSANNNLSWTAVRDLLRQTARCIDAEGGNWQNGRSYFYGSGRLDVHAAVRAAAGATP